MLSMGLANYIFYKYMDLMNVVDFVLRVAMVDEMPIQTYKLKMKYQKLLALAWMWALLILSQSYVGNLRALLTKPQLEKSINNIEDLLNQNDVKWSSEMFGDEILEYLKEFPPGSTMRGLLDKADTRTEWDWDNWFGPCFLTEQRDARTWASICDVLSIDLLRYWEFRDTKKCHYYTIDDTFFMTPTVMAFQVVYDPINTSFLIYNEMQLAVIMWPSRLCGYGSEQNLA